MSQTMEEVRNRVREKTRDTDSRNIVRDFYELDDAIMDAYETLASYLPSPKLYTAGAFSIAANAQTFALPNTGAFAGVEYDAGVEIQLDSDKTFLLPSTRDEIKAFRHGNTSLVGTGKPLRFALYEEVDQQMQGECWPRSKDTELCNLFVSLAVNSIRTAASIDAGVIQFSRYGSTALVLRASSIVVSGMTAEELDRLKLSSKITDKWEADLGVLLYQEEMRRHSAEDAGRTQRWVP